MTVPYEHLTDKQRLYICNGCGGKGSWFIPPYSVMFQASCDHHDYGYWKGGSEEDRLLCDLTFRKYLRKDISRKPYWSRWYYYIWAELYFSAVKYKGSKYFHYVSTKRNVDDYDWDLIFNKYNPEDIIPWNNCLLT